ncbi:MAG: MBOAT family O-acyltransferase, partial [Bacteroidales bacterium]|nr:MBOAT family O-acyltransferase [Bacteroidales bacterium]
MNFLSISFWAAFCAFFLIYIFVRKWSRTAMLLWVLAFDLFFFWQANGWLMLLLPATAAVNYFLTELLRSTHQRPGVPAPRLPSSLSASAETGFGATNPAAAEPSASGNTGAAAKWVLALIVLLDLGALVYFKYAGFFAGIWNSLTGSNLAIGEIVLPIGISFYTFQAISYSVDVYRGTYDGRPDFLEFCFYLSFFPLLLAGPITRAGRFLPQIRRARPATRRELRLGFWLVICGLLKKGVLADYLAVYNNLAFDSPVAYSGYELLMAVLGYTMQIYLDFSGYSDLSIGIAALMGFRLDDNFLFPYRSLNLTEFWRRWHISLSTWFRDYVYIPLGGNRKGLARTLLNNFLTMVVAGLWHGSTWMFVLWGALHGAGLAVHKLCRGWLKRIPDSWPVKALSWVLTMAFVMACWVFFRAGSLQDVGEIFRRIFTEFDLAYAAPFWAARKLWCCVLAVAAAGLLIPPRAYNALRAGFKRLPWVVIFLAFLLAVQLVIQLRSGDIQP